MISGTKVGNKEKKIKNKIFRYLKGSALKWLEYSSFVKYFN